MHKRLLIAVAVLAAIAAGGGAYAAATGDGTIRACAKTETGQLRLDTGTGCLPSETSLAWSPTRADERYFFGSLTNIEQGKQIVTGVWPDVKPAMTRILTQHFAPGNYAVTMEIVATNYNGDGVVVCLLGNSSAGNEVGQSAVGNGPGFAVQQTFEAQTVFALPQGGDLELTCFNAPQGDQPAGTPRINLADVVATKVDSISSTQEP